MVENTMLVAHAVENNPALEARMKEDPISALKEMAIPLRTDVWIYRAVVASLGGCLMFVVAAAAVLSMYGKPIPDVLTALGPAAVAALAGLLASSPGR